jgi:hypothetical protein
VGSPNFVSGVEGASYHALEIVVSGSSTAVIHRQTFFEHVALNHRSSIAVPAVQKLAKSSNFSIRQSLSQSSYLVEHFGKYICSNKEHRKNVVRIQQKETNQIEGTIRSNKPAEAVNVSGSEKPLESAELYERSRAKKEIAIH